MTGAMDNLTFERRREALRAKIAAQNLDGLLVAHAANRYYLSGFELHDPQCNECAGMLLVTRDGEWLLTDGRYRDAALRLLPEDSVFVYTAPKIPQIRDFLKDKCPGALGFEDSSLSFRTHRELSEGLALAPCRDLVEGLRVIKDAAEIELMRRSCALNHAVFRQAPSLLVPGRSEAQIAWDLEKLFRDRGAEGMAFSSIVAVDRNAALPHAIPGGDRVAENGLVLVDMGCRLDGYCSDQTRTFWVGEKPTDHFAQAMERVREAQDAAIAAIRPGRPARDAYQAARAVFEKHGVADRFTHGLGHGIGLETHEAPSASAVSEAVFAPGMVVTAEPGLYYPEWGGIRWEYMVLVTEDGCEVL
ncbi:MAG: Xaa-Pro peptidase family protein [Thermodesulfobacteriota bacterium]